MRIKKFKKTKKQAQTKHAIQRAELRYGVVLNDHDLNQVVKLIQSGYSEIIEEQSNRVSIRKINYKNTDFILVYDKERKSIATFLPPEAEANPGIIKQDFWNIGV